MKRLQTMKVVLWSSVGVFLVCLTMLLMLPLLNRMLLVAPAEPVCIPEPEVAEIRQTETLLVTAVYQKEAEGKIEAIRIELFHTDTGNAYYMEIPVHTKVTLSAELYQKLQAYSPELPQYFTLENMGGYFSEEYCMTGCNHILSEVLGIEIKHYTVASAEAIIAWRDGVQAWSDGKETARGFFTRFADWVAASSSDLTQEERWVYYESYREIILHETEQAPGAEGPSEYIIAASQVKRRLEEMMLKKRE